MASLEVIKELSEADGGNKGNIEQRVKDYLRRMLGEDLFLLCKNFFESVWGSSAPYKVFLARRCMNLMYMFYMCADDDWHRDSLESSFFSDGALLSNAREIAEIYRESHTVPEILIVDELLIHGRTLNQLISELVERIYRFLCEEGDDVDRTRLETDVLNAVHIRVILQNNKQLLLYGIYQRNLRSEKIRPIRKWHQFSSGVSQAIAGGVVANTSFVPTLQMRAFADNDAKKIYRHLSERADSLFTAFSWRKRFLEKAWIYPLTNEDGAVKAIYTLRVVPSEMDGTKLIVPFVIFSDIRAQKGSLYQMLCSKLFKNFDLEMQVALDNVLRYWQADSPAWMEALSLIFSQNLLLLLMQDCKIPGWEKGIDYEKIRMSFRSLNNDVAALFYDRIVERTTPWMALEQMNKALLELTYDAEPLCHIQNIDDTEKSKESNEWIVPIENTVGDVLSKYGQQAEYHAFRQRTGREFLSGRGIANKPLSDILYQVSHNYSEGMTQTIPNKQILSCVVSVLLRYMDIGAAATVVSYNESSDYEGYSNMCRAGEQSLFILPQRYSCYLPILSVMEQDCMRDLERLTYRMKEFLTPILKQKTVGDLITFTESLYEIGQYLQDWDIDLSGWVDWSWEESDSADTIKPPDVQRRSMNVLLDNLVIQSELLTKYLKFVS